MIIEQSEQIIQEVSKALMGKRDVVEKVLMAIYAGGHVLLEDYPGVGKTTLALAFSKALGLDYKRMQFTSDTTPSDVMGYSVYNRQTEQLDYKPGAVNCQLLLADEINRTSPKSQSALLEVMEEGCVTVDSVTHQLPRPFICIATQNPVGSAGTQPLPESQLDRFMIRLSIGYPSMADQVQILRAHQGANPLDAVRPVVTGDDLVEVQNYLAAIKVTDELLKYAIRLCESTRHSEATELGVSPRGVGALCQMARARAVLKERTFVVPEDIRAVFVDVCAHRIVLRPQAKIEGITVQALLEQILRDVPPPALGNQSR